MKYLIVTFLLLILATLIYRVESREKECHMVYSEMCLLPASDEAGMCHEPILIEREVCE